MIHDSEYHPTRSPHDAATLREALRRDAHALRMQAYADGWHYAEHLVEDAVAGSQRAAHRLAASLARHRALRAQAEK